MRVAVVGQGYVGIPLAIAAAESGHHVTGIDIDSQKIELLNFAKSPIGDISDSTIEAVIRSGNYQASDSFSSLSSSDVICICVPTPLDSNHKPDLRALEGALEAVAVHISEDALVIIESTISPGTTRKYGEGILKTLSKHGKFQLAFSPERIDPANKKWNVKNTPKLVAGITPEATARATKFYSTFVASVHSYNSVEAVETAKLLENSFRLVNISFINEIAAFCEKLEISVLDVISAAATKPYGFMPFYPSAGVGGHCIPVDPSYLAEAAREIGAPTRFIDLANEVNLAMPSYFVGKADGMLNGLKGKKVLVVGVAYKPDVADMRETPAAALISLLRDGGAEVKWHDDLVVEWDGEQSVNLSDEYDLAILVNPHTHTKLNKLGSTPVLNTRGGN